MKQARGSAAGATRSGETSLSSGTARRVLTVETAEDMAILQEVSAPVEAVTDEVRALMRDMLASMRTTDGIGLAAVQIGVLQRVVVMDLTGAGEKGVPLGPRFFVNPEIVSSSRETQAYDEGCLSIPDFFSLVVRPARVDLRLVEERAEGVYAMSIQHEMDHLNGVLFVDHLVRSRRDRVLAKLARKE